MTQPPNGPYDWGTPQGTPQRYTPHNTPQGPSQQQWQQPQPGYAPQAPGQQNQPNQPTQFNQQGYPGGAAQPGPSSSSSSEAKNLKPILIGIGSLLGALLLVFVGLTIFQSVRSTPAGPLDWDDETLQSRINGTRVKNCELGDDFYQSVGVTDLATSDGGSESCSGWVPVNGGKLKVFFKTDTSASSGEMATAKGEGLEDWKQTADPFVNVPAELNGSSSSQMKCDMFSKDPALKGVVLNTAGPCEALYPMAQQLTNIARQVNFSVEDHGLFSFSGPDYVEVAQPSGDMFIPAYKKLGDAAVKTGDAIPVADEDYDGSTLTIDDVTVEEEKNSSQLTYKVCAQTTFKLGRKKEEYAGSFTVPNIHAFLPNGSGASLNSEEGYFRLKEGETKPVKYCGSLTTDNFRPTEMLVGVGDSTSSNQQPGLVKREVK